MSRARPESGLIVVAERCHTLCARPKAVQAIGIKGEMIVATGTRRQVRTVVGRSARVLDLGSAVVTPGLVDCHTHFFYWALQRAFSVELSGTRTLDQALDRIRRHARGKAPDEWVLGNGFDPNHWPTGLPGAADLDRVVSDAPALIRARDGHSVWLNTRGLERAGITRNTSDPPGGRFVRDRYGAPSGIAQETAIDQLPNPLREFALRRDRAAIRRIDRALDAGYQFARQHGLVGFHTVDDAPSLFHFQRQRQVGQLGLRVVHAIPLQNLAEAQALGLRAGLGDDWLRVQAVKIFADGALGSQTALMFDDYPERPGDRGVPVVAGAELIEQALRAASAGWPLWIHAIGDRAVHEAISAIAAARKATAVPLVHRIEHAQCVRPADIRRMARLGIVASVQPCHLPGDVTTADRHWPKARRNAYPLRRMLDSGVILAAGSDVPIETLDPRRSFFGAVARIDDDGAPADGWFPQQRITAGEVLRAFTIGAARSVGKPAPHGTLAPGAPADLTVWAEDPLRLDAAALREVPMYGCIVAGRLHLEGATD